MDSYWVWVTFLQCYYIPLWEHAVIYSITDEHLGSSSILATVSDTTVNILGLVFWGTCMEFLGPHVTWILPKRVFQSGLYPLTHPLLTLSGALDPHKPLECLSCPPLLFWWECSVSSTYQGHLFFMGRLRVDLSAHLRDQGNTIPVKEIRGG